MFELVFISGKVGYTITLDPTTWIFDERKILLEQAFDTPLQPEELEPEARLEKDAEAMAKKWHFDWERIDVPVTPRLEQKKLVNRKGIEGDWAMWLGPFLKNAEPNEDAKGVILHLSSGERHELTLEEAFQGIACFALNGRALKEDGPIHFYYGDGRNRKEPIRGVEVIQLI